LQTFSPSDLLLEMTSAVYQWGLSNPGPGTLTLWLEPWAEEFEVLARTSVTLVSSDGSENCLIGQMEWTADRLVVWATAQTVAVSIDGVLQQSASAIIPIPDGLTKETLGILFADQPAARLGGTGLPATK
jgi:hypothetical protein